MGVHGYLWSIVERWLRVLGVLLFSIHRADATSCSDTSTSARPRWLFHRYTEHHALLGLLQAFLWVGGQCCQGHRHRRVV